MMKHILASVLLWFMTFPLWAADGVLGTVELDRIKQELVRKNFDVKSIKASGPVTSTQNTKVQSVTVEINRGLPIQFFLSLEISGRGVDPNTIVSSAVTKFQTSYFLALNLPEGMGAKEIKSLVGKTLANMDATIEELTKRETGISSGKAQSGLYLREVWAKTTQQVVDRLKLLKIDFARDLPHIPEIQTGNVNDKLLPLLEDILKEYQTAEIQTEKKIALLSVDTGPNAITELGAAMEQATSLRQVRLNVELVLIDLREVIDIETKVGTDNPSRPFDMKAFELKEVRHALTTLKLAQAKLKVILTALESSSDPKDFAKVRQSFILVAGAFQRAAGMKGLGHKILGHGAELFILEERLLKLSGIVNLDLADVTQAIESVEHLQRNMLKTEAGILELADSLKGKTGIQTGLTLKDEMRIFKEQFLEARRLLNLAHVLKLRVR